MASRVSLVMFSIISYQICVGEGGLNGFLDSLDVVFQLVVELVEEEVSNLGHCFSLMECSALGLLWFISHVRYSFENNYIVST